MGGTFSQASEDVAKMAKPLIINYHLDLDSAAVKIDYIFAFAELDKDGEQKAPAIMHQGYKALAVARKIHSKTESWAEEIARSSSMAINGRICRRKSRKLYWTTNWSISRSSAISMAASSTMTSIARCSQSESMIGSTDGSTNREASRNCIRRGKAIPGDDLRRFRTELPSFRRGWTTQHAPA